MVVVFKEDTRHNKTIVSSDIGMVMVPIPVTLDGSLCMFRNTTKNKRTNENQE